MKKNKIFLYLIFFTIFLSCKNIFSCFAPDFGLDIEKPNSEYFNPHLSDRLPYYDMAILEWGEKVKQNKQNNNPQKKIPKLRKFKKISKIKTLKKKKKLDFWGFEIIEDEEDENQIKTNDNKETIIAKLNEEEEIEEEYSSPRESTSEKYSSPKNSFEEFKNDDDNGDDGDNEIKSTAFSPIASNLITEEKEIAIPVVLSVVASNLLKENISKKDLPPKGDNGNKIPEKCYIIDPITENSSFKDIEKYFDEKSKYFAQRQFHQLRKNKCSQNLKK